MSPPSSSSFLSRLAKLNEGQQKAVMTTEGPVMVIAGPGTGKTETLGARIANILQNQVDIKPANILCLTYTNAGVVAMRKRLLEFIGSSAHSVQIHTFHSFCNQVIQENPEIFGIKNAENISELEQHELVDNIIDGLSTSNPLFKKSGYHYTKQLLSLFSTIKAENWKKEDIQKKVQEYLDDLPNREAFIYKVSRAGYKKGDVKQKDIDAEHEKMKKLLSGVELFELYQSALKARGAYDFQDMIQWIIHAFETNEMLLARYQERFLYILVDEFQDTNGSQKKVVDLLTSFWESPNIFVVGDDDQSIYRFQGANMRNIVSFWQQHSSDIEVVSIDKNYRSSPNILALAQHIISKNTERLTHELPTLQKNLTACHHRFLNTENPPPNLISYANPLQETLGVFQHLKALQESGVNLNEVAVIYQNHAQVEDLLKMCSIEKIPVRVKQEVNILELPIVKNLITMLEYLWEEHKNPFSAEDKLFAMFHFPWFSISFSEIQHIALARRTSECPVFFKTLLEQSPPESSLRKLFDTIAFLEQELFSSSFLGFLEAVLKKTNILNYALEHEDRSLFFRSLQSFFSFAKDMLQKDPDTSLGDILSALSRMRQHSLKLSIQKTSSYADGVQFVTAHSSKGLEFEHVFLVGVEKKIWDTSRRSDGFSFPDTLTLSNVGNFLEEKRRLFFVAITRAKKYLQISYSENDLNGAEKDPSVFISECSELISPVPHHFSEEEVMDMQARLFEENPSRHSSLLFDKPFLDTLLEGYVMSATHLNKFLACPVSFYYENLLRIPAAKSQHSSFGSAVHSALEQYFKSVEKSEKVFLEAFEIAMEKNRFGFSPEEYKKFLRHGKDVLPVYFHKKLTSLPLEDFKIEYSVKSYLEGIPLSGRFDRIDFVEPKKIRVIDYKTGNPKKAADKLATPSEKNNFLGGDYWRQMVFYAILLETDVRNVGTFSEGVFDFVESSDGFEKRFFVSDEEKEIVKNQIKTAYHMIMQGQFSGCGKEECEWCKVVGGH